MKSIAVIALVLASLHVAGAQIVQGDTVARSVSGQFVVRSLPSGRLPPGPPRLPAAADRLRLDPSFVAVSCERIKQALFTELQAVDPWHGKIYVDLYRAQPGADGIGVVSERSTDGWAYRVRLPDTIEPRRFARVMVNVLLVEVANRSSDARSAEVPVWLAEGVTELLLAASGAEIVLTSPAREEGGLLVRRMNLMTDYRSEKQRMESGPPAGAGGADTFKPHPLEGALNTLQSHTPITFEQLSWPDDASLSGEAGEVYRASAHLFVHQLLRMKGGPACLRSMLDALPRRYNWQMALLDGFQPYFQKPLDVEKWWALELARYANREGTHAWTVTESCRQLDDVLHAVVQVRSSGQDLPMRTEVPLQTVLREWDGVRQAAVLQPKMNDLDLLRMRVSQEVIPLVDEYRLTIGTYMQKLGGRGWAFPFGGRGQRLSSAAQAAIGQLDVLDAKRAALWPVPDAGQ